LRDLPLLFLCSFVQWNKVFFALSWHTLPPLKMKSRRVVGAVENNPMMHACIVRKQTNTLKDSVYSQIQWASMSPDSY
jgi:hypothetical protein